MGRCLDGWKGFLGEFFKDGRGEKRGGEREGERRDGEKREKRGEEGRKGRRCGGGREWSILSRSARTAPFASLEPHISLVRSKS